MAFGDVMARSIEEDSFDANESEDLKLHVRQCGRRYRALDRKLNIVIRLMVAMIVLYVLGAQGAASALVSLFRSIP